VQFCVVLVCGDTRRQIYRVYQKKYQNQKITISVTKDINIVKKGTKKTKTKLDSTNFPV
jgi:hypothetical protein